MRIYLRTERMVLREFVDSDVDDLVALDNDPGVLRYIGGGPDTPAEVRHDVLPRWFRYYEQGDRFGYWAAVERACGTFLGWFELKPSEQGSADNVELGYRLRTASWGRGYGTEGARALVWKAFDELGVARVFARTMAVNHPSRRVLEKAGLELVGTYYELYDELIDGAEHGEVEYALHRSDWRG